MEGLRDARPDSANKAKDGEKPLSAKERRKLRARERDKLKAGRRKLEEAVRKLEKEIMELEEKQKEVNEQLADPQSYGDSEKAKELNDKASSIARRLKERNYEWEIETEKLLALDE